jgi:FkbM family methyltransferase
MSKVTPRWVARNVVRRIPVANARLPLNMWANLWEGEGVDAPSIIRRLADQAGRPLTFVQIGSNDGSMGDPLHDVVVKYGWRGVLVEPLPHLHAALRETYRQTPGLLFEQSAIGAADGTMTMYSVNPWPGDPEWVRGLSSFRRDVILESANEIPDIAARVEEVDVPVLRLETLLERHRINHIDLLQTDTEGYDFEILRQIDFSAPWAPQYLIYESCHLDSVILEKTHEMLKAAGYTVMQAGYDEFAYRA